MTGPEQGRLPDRFGTERLHHPPIREPIPHQGQPRRPACRCTGRDRRHGSGPGCQAAAAQPVRAMYPGQPSQRRQPSRQREPDPDCDRHLVSRLPPSAASSYCPSVGRRRPSGPGRADGNDVGLASSAISNPYTRWRLWRRRSSSPACPYLAGETDVRVAHHSARSGSGRGSLPSRATSKIDVRCGCAGHSTSSRTWAALSGCASSAGSSGCGTTARTRSSGQSSAEEGLGVATFSASASASRVPTCTRRAVQASPAMTSTEIPTRMTAAIT